MHAIHVDEKKPANAGDVKVWVRVFDQETRIGVRVERCGWVHSFTVRLKDGALPPQYAADPEIVAAYRRVVSARERWQRRPPFPSTDGTTLR